MIPLKPDGMDHYRIVSQISNQVDVRGKQENVEVAMKVLILRL